MLSLLRELYAHMQWADALVWRAVLALPAAEHDAPLREKLVHVHMVQRAFLSVWRGQGPDFREDFESLAEVAQWGREYHDAVLPFVEAFDETALDRPMVMPWAGRFAARLGRDAEATTLRETLMQVVLHSTYHRGQVNARLRELGGEPPLTDYIAWIWIGKPPAEWP